MTSTVVTPSASSPWLPGRARRVALLLGVVEAAPLVFLVTQIDHRVDLLFVAFLGLTAAVGWLLSLRVTGNPIGWLLLATAGLFLLGPLAQTSVARLLPASDTLAVAGATLAAAAVVRPVLRRVRNHMDHRFNRARFDAALEVEAFATRLRDSMATDAAVADLPEVVQRTLRPAALGRWTRGAPR